MDWDWLRQELVSDDPERQTFLLKLRVELHWDKAHFTRLEEQLRLACADLQGAEAIDRWLVEGSWSLFSWLPDWTNHPSFPRPGPDGYHEAALQRLRDLHYWFAIGESPYMPDHTWESI
jgi:hypothetical protein